MSGTPRERRASGCSRTAAQGQELTFITRRIEVCFPVVPSGLELGVAAVVNLAMLVLIIR